MTHCKSFEGYDPPCTKEKPCDMCEMNIELLRRDRRGVRLRALADGYKRRREIIEANVWRQGHSFGENNERARIVAKARSYADVCERAGADMRWLRAFADEIEGGE